MWLGWELLSLQIIFSNTPALGGWGQGELVALLGVWRLVNTLMIALIWPNTEKFNTSVRDGSLDYTLLQPVSSQFLVSFSRIVIWRAWDVALAATLIIYSLWIVLISCTFWFIKFDNNVTILQALMDSGRYPATVYPAWLRVVITFVIPIAVATTVPLQALRGDLVWWQVLLFLAISAASLLISAGVWRAGVRRYSGASS
jgi:ABC-2 type transport system permease protein